MDYDAADGWCAVVAHFVWDDLTFALEVAFVNVGNASEGLHTVTLDYIARGTSLVGFLLWRIWDDGNGCDGTSRTTCGAAGGDCTTGVIVRDADVD